MKTILFLAIGVSLSIPDLVHAQAANPASFNGATTTKYHNQEVYQLNSDEEAKIKATLKNIQNCLDDPRLKGNLEVELVVQGAGIAGFQKDKSYEELIKNLQNQGVILAMCENTMRERKVSKDDLSSFVSYVPNGNGELVIRQQQGWAFMHP
ncbi:DsrE family protein [Spirosoma flavum]|uniref:DsrE family protein n=1 Tax=Spirosoma flavum TaxID=2048557 RepID=A0ABW6AH80_9BACT